MKGWAEKRLGEVCTLQRGFDLPTSQRKEGDYPLISSSGCIDSQAEVKVSGPGVVTGRSGSIGSVFFIDQDFWPLNTTLYVKDFHGNDPRFIYYLLRKFDLKRFASGTGVPTLNRNSVHSELVYIPSTTSEQKRIVAIADQAFEGIDRAIANTEKNLTNARELFESYLNSILSGQGKEWKKTTLGKEIDLLTGFAFKSSGYTDSDKSIRLLRGDNIIPGSLRWDGVKRWPESKVNEYLRYQLQEGDVVLAMDRPWIKAGLRRAQISKDDLPCLLVQRTACLRGCDNLENRFLLYLISGRAFTQHVLGSQTGLSVPHISGTQIQSFKFNKPSLREQYSIIDSLDELKSETQRLEAIYQQKLSALNELKQSILQKAFTGELTADTTNQATKIAKEVVAA